MPKGMWASTEREKRRAAARKGAASRARRREMRRFLDTGEPVPGSEAALAAQGSEADRVMPGAAITALIARIRDAKPEGQ